MIYCIGYLYNFQTKELYNLNYLQDYGGEPVGINGKFLMMKDLNYMLPFLSYVPLWLILCFSDLYQFMSLKYFFG